MDRPGDIKVLCRLCLVKDQVNNPIFGEEGDIRQIFLKISCCLPVSISIEDNLPKNICDQCWNKLELQYEFWNTSVNAEKTLLRWLGQAGVKDADGAISAVAQHIAKSEVEVKVEEPDEIDGGEENAEADGEIEQGEEFEENFKDDEGEVEDFEEPPPKKARRSAAVKAQMTLANVSDDDEDDEPMTKVEDVSDESEGEVKDPFSFAAVPGTSANDQPGPSGVGKVGGDAPLFNISTDHESEGIRICLEREPLQIKDELNFKVEDNRYQDENLSMRENNRLKVQHLQKCLYCSECFTQNSYLRKHVIQIHIKTDEKFKCEFCDKSFKKKCYLRQHTNKFHLENFSCVFCKKSFKHESDLLSHTKILHPGNNKTFKCVFCDKSLKNELYLRLHVKRIHWINNEKFNCKLCDKSFVQRIYLLRHIRRIHSRKNETFKCGFCDKSFKQKVYLYEHVKRLHSQTKESLR